MASADLRSVFEAFASFGSGREPAAVAGLDGRGFVKLFKDCGLFCKRFTPTDADLIFSSVKPRGGKRISFEAFEGALEKVAAKKQLSVAEVASKIVAAGGPKATGTKAEACRFYDDKTTWTSTSKNGGPTSVDGQKRLAGLCDRTPSDARGVSSGAFNRAH